MDYKDYVVLDEKYLRPEELHDLRGDSTKIRTELGWKPNYTFESMLDDMIEDEKRESGFYKTQDEYVPYDPVR